MFTIKHIRTGTATLLGLFALGIGGSAVANATQSQPTVKPASVSTTAPGASQAADPSGPNDKADAADPADRGSESASEVPDGDGPGGHADEVGAQR